MNSKDQLALLSEDQRIILKQFRETVQDILQPRHDDYFLLRWLRARDFDIRKAEKMILESFRFRKKLNIDELVTDKYVMPEVYKNYNVSIPLGLDKEGCMVRLIMFGICDFKGFTYSLHLTELLRVVSHILETDQKALAENCEKTGSHEARCVYIADFRDFNLRQFYDKHVIHVVIQTLGMYQDNYPETLKVAFITNVPSYFNWIWNIFKPFLHPVTLSKIKIFKADDISWQRELLDMVDPKIIPAFLGGVLCDPDGNPTCQTLLKWPGKVPASYYLKDRSALRSDDPNVKYVVVRGRSCFECKVPVKKPRSTIRWEFQTKDYNIRFGVLYQKVSLDKIQNTPPDELLAVENVECHILPETGELLCEKAGQYILHFDNTYSWLTSKHLLYKVIVEEPEETNEKNN